MNELIVRTLIELIVAIEFSNEDQMNPDYSISLLEAVTSHFSELSPSEVDSFMVIARDFSGEFDNPDVRDFVSSKERLMGFID